MWKKRKKILSIFLTFCLLVSIVPGVAFADDTTGGFKINVGDLSAAWVKKSSFDIAGLGDFNESAVYHSDSQENVTTARNTIISNADTYAASIPFQVDRQAENTDVIKAFLAFKVTDANGNDASENVKLISPVVAEGYESDYAFYDVANNLRYFAANAAEEGTAVSSTYNGYSDFIGQYTGYWGNPNGLEWSGSDVSRWTSLSTSDNAVRFFADKDGSYNVTIALVNVIDAAGENPGAIEIVTEETVNISVGNGYQVNVGDYEDRIIISDYNGVSEITDILNGNTGEYGVIYGTDAGAKYDSIKNNSEMIGTPIPFKVSRDIAEDANVLLGFKVAASNGGNADSAMLLSPVVTDDGYAGQPAFYNVLNNVKYLKENAISRSYVTDGIDVLSGYWGNPNGQPWEGTGERWTSLMDNPMVFYADTLGEYKVEVILYHYDTTGDGLIELAKEELTISVEVPDIDVKAVSGDREHMVRKTPEQNGREYHVYFTMQEAEVKTIVPGSGNGEEGEAAEVGNGETETPTEISEWIITLILPVDLGDLTRLPIEEADQLLSFEKVIGEEVADYTYTVKLLNADGNEPSASDFTHFNQGFKFEVGTYTYSVIFHAVAAYDINISGLGSVTINDGAPAAISVSGTIVGEFGNNTTISASPDTDSNYYFGSLIVDGVNVGSDTKTLNSGEIESRVYPVSASFYRSGGGGSGSSRTYTITVDAGNGGRITPGTSEAPANSTRTFNITPNSGYEIDDVRVDGKSVGKVKSYTFRLIDQNHTIKATFVSEEDKDDNKVTIGQLRDISSSAWYYDAVKFVVDRQLMVGISDNSFGPDTNMTRAMFVTVLGRAAEEKGKNVTTASVPFKDVVTSQWYGKYVGWAYENGIVEGYSSTQFGVNDSITREQMAAIMVRFADYMKVDLKTGNSKTFTDDGSISSWARTDVAKATAAGLLYGYEDGSFKPRGTATRAEVASVFRFLVQDYLDDIDDEDDK